VIFVAVLFKFYFNAENFTTAQNFSATPYVPCGRNSASPDDPRCMTENCHNPCI